jgi:hypothetical protein
MAANDWRFNKSVQRAARLAFHRSGAGSLRQAVHIARQQYTAGAKSALAVPGLQQLTAAYRRGGVGGFVHLAGGQGGSRTLQAIERYARNPTGRQLISEVLRQLGPVGSILGAIVGQDRGNRSLPSDLRFALDFVKAFADQPSVLGALQRILEGRGAKVQWPGGSPSTAVKPRGAVASLAAEIADAIKQAEGSGTSGGRGDSGRGRSGGGRGRGGGASEPPAGGGDGGGGDGRVAINVDGEIQRLAPNHPLVTGEMIETPESANVHSFGFHNDTHSLFVRFKDNPRKAQLAGGYGIGGVFHGSGRGRPHRPGALYLYHHVPAKLFLAFITASSKGGWVWDHLRIRGTLSGHQYDYALVGVQGGYVPRKATLTPLGESFIPRSIFTDRGRQLSSPLPEELIRPLRPVYPGEDGGGLGRRPNDGSGGLGGRGRRR